MSEVVRIHPNCPKCNAPLTAIIERRGSMWGMTSYLLNLVRR